MGRTALVPSKHHFGLALKVWLVSVLVVFVFGEGLLRMAFDLSWYKSLVIWAGSLAVLLLCGGAMAVGSDD